MSTGDLILGVDPGARATGLVVLNSLGNLVTHNVIERPADEHVLAWCNRCTEAAQRLLLTALGFGPDAHLHRDPDLNDLVDDLHPVVLAIEAVVEPNPHRNRANGKAIINTGGIIDTAAVFGAFANFPGTGPGIAVRPGGHGSQPYATYPDELITPAERRAKGWRLRPAGQSSTIRHARSAYDVARTVHHNRRLLNEGRRHG
jgi:hypothetical protein